MKYLKFNAFIQARMSSKRLPGKVLKLLGERPILKHVYDRVALSPLVSEVIILTSNQSSDDSIEQYCTDSGIQCFRGDLDNVAQRFLEATEKYPCDFFVRVCADSPFFDAEIMDAAIIIASHETADLVTNTFPRTYPAGLSVEVISSHVYKEAYPKFSSLDHLEHVTPYFYENAQNFIIKNITQSTSDDSSVNLCVDDKDDFERATKLVEDLGCGLPDRGWRDMRRLF